MEKKRGRGRPKNDPLENASELVTIRLTPPERKLCEQAAAVADEPLRGWLRSRIVRVAKREAKRA